MGDAIGVGNGPSGVAVGEGAVWVTNRFDGTISRIDPNRGKVVKTIPVGLDPRGITTGFGSVWVGLAGSTQVVRIDPATNEVTKPIGVGDAPGSLAESTDDLWVVNTLDDTVSEIDPDTNSVVDLIPVGDGPSGIAVVDGIVWVTNEADGTLSRIEPGETPGQPSVRTLVIGSVPQGLAGVNGELWVSVWGTATSHRGGTLQLVSKTRPDSIDTTVAYADPSSFRVLHLLGDGLVAFEPIGGTTPAVVPDLATSLPTISPDGRTYTFDLRPGIRYSNGEVVAPSDFRRALERGFRLEPGGHPYLYSGLIGADACVTGQACDLSRGIKTEDETGTITFHLADRDPEFLYKLTMPFAYPVPASVSDAEGERARIGIPGTGPYMLETAKTRKGLALVRNPLFDVWSSDAQPDGYADRIEWRFGVKPDAQIEAVKAGDVDVALDASDSGRLEEIFVQYAGQVHASSQAATYYVTFGTETRPFDKVEVRRAMNLALDRDWLVQLLGGEAAALPTCQQLPPNFPGYEPYCPYTADLAPEGRGSWTATNMEGARDIVLASGTARMRVVLEYVPGNYPQGVVDYLIELFDDLGYRGSARPLSIGDFLSPHKFQMALNGWFADYPAASNFMNLLKCGVPTRPSGGFCSPRIDEMIDRATQMQFVNPTEAGALWAETDRAIVDQAPNLWMVNPIAVEFVSERVGNYQWTPQWYELLNQIWVL